MIVADTSVAVAAALASHEAHAAAASALTPGPTPIVAHVALEAYSVLTRLPPPLRVSGPAAWEYLTTTFEFPPLTLSPDGYRELLAAAAADGVAGGAVYDALVGATAREAGATLLTLDRRAVTTYERVGVEHRLLA